jgi:hypothetical protein
MQPNTDSRFWRWAIGVTLALAAGVLFAMFSSTYHGDVDNFRLEAAKLLLQFLLVGVGGTLVLAMVNQRRDDAARAEAARKAAAEAEAARKAEEEADAASRQTAALARAAVRRAALQDLIRQIGEAHRRLKVVKRQMRAAIPRDEPDPQGPPDHPYRIPAAAFERAMDALLNAQIASEEVRDRIEISVDLLERMEIDRIRKALRYGSRYFHDVYQDYEHGRIKRDGDDMLVTSECKNMHNFLFAREPPGDLPPEKRERLQELFNKMHEETRSLEDRYAAFYRIEELRQADRPGARRYRSIATECFSLAGDALRNALWHTCSRDAVHAQPGDVAPAAAAVGAALA